MAANIKPARGRSIYSYIKIPIAKRASRDPRVARPYRIHRLTTISAFFRNRFYELDRWYKARIERPLKVPKCFPLDPDDIQKTLTERLQELRLSTIDANSTDQVDIGLPFSPEKPDEEVAKLLAERRKDADIERLARHRELKLDVIECEHDSHTQKIVHPLLLKCILHHFNIFKDLFHPDSFFHPIVPLCLSYTCADAPDHTNRVFFGNTILPGETMGAPDVDFPSAPDDLWTLLMVNPDGNVFEEGKDVVHWLVCNIRGNDVKSGQTVYEYIQPLPPRGTGWHRIVFVLFKQSARLPDEVVEKFRTQSSESFAERSFDTPMFYKANEERITPAGAAFFQAEWDRSCTKCFHEKLKMPEPSYDFEWPQVVLPKQVEFAKQRPFDRYLDMYRDPKEIEREVLVKRLARVSPFRPNPARLKYPNVFFDDDRSSLPTWQHARVEKERLGLGKWRGLYENTLPAD